jgi:hypothetical protein
VKEHASPVLDYQNNFLSAQGFVCHCHQGTPHPVSASSFSGHRIDQWLVSYRLPAGDTRLAFRSTPYRVARIFGLMLLLAAMNRFWLVQGLTVRNSQQRIAKTLLQLRYHVMSEQLLGLVIVAIVSFRLRDPTETLVAAEVFRKSLDLDRREL